MLSYDLHQMNADRIQSLEARLLKEERQRNAIHYEVMEMKGNIRVYVRLRPLLSHERKAGTIIASSVMVFY